MTGKLFSFSCVWEKGRERQYETKYRYLHVIKCIWKNLGILNLFFRWNRNHSTTTVNEKDKENSAKFLGTPVCPRMEEIAIIEPLICKKIAHERLTGLIFREDCVVTACQEGFILTWARPGKVYKIFFWSQSLFFSAWIFEGKTNISDCFRKIIYIENLLYYIS